MRALIAMSGGVDSSVAAALMIKEGYECIGCTMVLYDNDTAETASDRTCCSADDVSDARSVAAKLNIPYYVLNFKEDFREKVVKKFADCYFAGRTPNPCVDCNRYMKFEKLYEKARMMDCDVLVTGHYARITFDGEKYHLKKAADPKKDQSYVLACMTQNQLSHTRFPLGEIEKSDARDLAEAEGFRNAHKADSQDICFVPDGDYARVVEEVSGKKSTPGNFVNTGGDVLGTHKGIIHYTVGQHKGLGLSLPEAMYVCEVREADNTVVLGHKEELYRSELVAGEFHFISGTFPTEPFHCKAKIRYRQAEEDCTVYPLDNRAVRLVFKEPQRAVTPGQLAVLYDGDEVLGSGTILKEAPNVS